jgi:hypothetical protein
MAFKKKTENPEQLLEKQATDLINKQDIAISLGRSFYDIIEVLKNKQLSLLAETKGKYQLHDEIAKELVQKMTTELEQAKSWGFDQLNRSIK